LAVILGGDVSDCSVYDSLRGSLAMRSKRVCVVILGVLMLLGKIILLSCSINVWVSSRCFRSNCITVWVDSVVQCLGIREGESAISTCKMGGVVIIWLGWGVTLWI